MSVNVNQTNLNPATALFAPAGSTGGGGGGVGPNPAFSSITVATGAILCPSTNISLISPGVNVSSLNVSSINNAQYPPAQTDVFSTITVSSINGAQYPPAQTDVFSTLTVSSLSAPAGQGISVLSDLNIDTNTQILGGGSNANTGASINGFQTISCGNLETSAFTVSSIQGYNADNLVYQSNASFSANGISCLTLQTSSILRLGNPQGGFPAPASSTQGLLPLGIPGTADAGSYTNMIQGGYVSQLPYLGTVLFQYPYQADNTPLCVQITPTNQGISPGQNPALSLNGGWGYAGTGVSSIGFSVDARNGGVGYAASFYWLAYPATQ